MNINFTGVQKTHGTYQQYPGKVLSEGFIDMQLTNENGEDLKEFQELLKKCPNRDGDDFLRIDFNQAKPPAWEKDGKTEYVLRINKKYLELNDKNLKFFTQIEKLLKKVASMDKKEVESPEKYLDSEECFDHVYGPIGVKELNDPKFKEDVLELHAPENVKNVAKNLNEDIEEMMMDYFA